MCFFKSIKVHFLVSELYMLLNLVLLLSERNCSNPREIIHYERWCVFPKVKGVPVQG